MFARPLALLVLCCALVAQTRVAAARKPPSCGPSAGNKAVPPLIGAKYEQALREAAQNFQSKEVAALLAAGVSPNGKDAQGYTALFRAAEIGCVECVKELLCRRADTEAGVASWHGGTALMTASEKGRLDVVRVLLAAKAEVNSPRADGFTALILAARAGHAEVVRALLANGALVKAKENYGGTALHHAVANKREGAVRVLLQGGADISLKDVYGKTPKDYASTDELRRLLSASG